jgi:broad-specificity NMP kinase
MAHSPRAPACLLVMCGIPGAGKTHLADALLGQAAIDSVASTEVLIHTITFDEFGKRQGVMAPFDPKAWRVRQLAVSVASLTCSLPLP